MQSHLEEEGKLPCKAETPGGGRAATPRQIHGAPTSLAPTSEANPVVFPNSCTSILIAKHRRGTDNGLLWDETQMAILLLSPR